MCQEAEAEAGETHWRVEKQSFSQSLAMGTNREWYQQESAWIQNTGRTVSAH